MRQPPQKRPEFKQAFKFTPLPLVFCTQTPENRQKYLWPKQAKLMTPAKTTPCNYQRPANGIKPSKIPHPEEMEPCIIQWPCAAKWMHSCKPNGLKRYAQRAFESRPAHHTPTHNACKRTTRLRIMRLHGHTHTFAHNAGALAHNARVRGARTGGGRGCVSLRASLYIFITSRS